MQLRKHFRRAGDGERREPQPHHIRPEAAGEVRVGAEKHGRLGGLFEDARGVAGLGGLPRLDERRQFAEIDAFQLGELHQFVFHRTVRGGNLEKKEVSLPAHFLCKENLAILELDGLRASPCG